jgi:hypothetical protein
LLEIQSHIKNLDNRFTQIFIVLTGTTLALLPVSPLNMSFASRDSGVFLYIGWRILNGEIPYVDIWDHKPPLIFFLNALGIFLTPNSLWGVWLVEWVFLAIAIWCSYKLTRSLFGFFPTLAVTLVWLVSFTITLAGGNLTTEYTLSFQFISLFLFLRQLRHPSWWNLFALGLTTALAFLTRQNSIALMLAIAISLNFNYLLNRKWKEILTSNFQMMIGAMIPITIVLIYFAQVRDGLATFWDAAFIYNFIYSGERTLADRFFAIQRGFQWLGQTGLFQLAVLGWFLCVFWLIKNAKSINPMYQFMLGSTLAMPLEILFASIGGRPRIPYFLALIPIFSVFASFLLWKVEILARKKITPIAITIPIILTLSILSIYLAPHYIESAKSYHLVLDTNRAISYVQANTSPDEQVLMWGAETSVNFFAKRRSPSRFVYQYPLHKSEYAGTKLFEEFLLDILENKPKLIIVTSSDRIPRSFGSTSDKTNDMINEIRRLYPKKERLGEWLVFERIQDSP